MYQPKNNEKAFPINPVLITYVCEHCGKGEMKVIPDQTPLKWPQLEPVMHKHRCTKCGGELLLPKTYPYIEWVPGEEHDEFYNKKADSD
jgi:DNA-directed RNA polymerase subunit RPC12/RpoP